MPTETSYAIFHEDPERLSKSIDKLKQLVKQQSQEFKERFDNMNTYSSELPSSRQIPFKEDQTTSNRSNKPSQVTNNKKRGKAGTSR